MWLGRTYEIIIDNETVMNKATGMSYTFVADSLAPSYPISVCRRDSIRELGSTGREALVRG